MDLTTNYLGLKLRTPLVLAASPLSEEIDNIKQMEDAGASAVVLLFAVRGAIAPGPLRTASSPEHGTDSFAEALTYFPEPEEFHLGPEEYLKHIAQAKEAVRHSHHRQPERLVGRRLDRIRQADPAGRRRRAGAEHLPHPHRHGSRPARTWSRPISTSSRR